MSAISVPGVSVYGANQKPIASASFSRAPKPSSYNASYLKTFRQTKVPIPVPRKPGDPKSVMGPFSGSDAAKYETPPAPPPSSYNATYLKTANTRSYPLGDGPMTQEKAFNLLRGAPEELTKAKVAEVALPKVYTPAGVLESLKLLADADLTDEELEAYEEDASRLRTYAATLKQRPLTADEQRVVDEIGQRLDAEANKLVAEDVGYDVSKRREIAALTKAKEDLEAEYDDAQVRIRDLLVSEQQSEERAQKAAALEAKYELEAAALDTPEFEQLKRAKARGWRGVNLAQVPAQKARLQLLQQHMNVPETRLLQARAAKDEAEQDADDARVARVAATALAGARGPEAALAAVELEAAKSTKRAVNPRFSARESKASKKAQLYADAVELRQKEPVEDKHSDEEFAKVGKEIKDFIDFNLGKKRSDPNKFISKEALALEWSAYAQAHPKVAVAPPWGRIRLREPMLQELFYSSKVPSEFKLNLLHRAGHI